MKLISISLFLCSDLDQETEEDREVGPGEEGNYVIILKGNTMYLLNVSLVHSWKQGSVEIIGGSSNHASKYVRKRDNGIICYIAYLALETLPTNLQIRIIPAW